MIVKEVVVVSFHESHSCIRSEANFTFNLRLGRSATTVRSRPGLNRLTGSPKKVEER